MMDLMLTKDNNMKTITLKYVEMFTAATRNQH